MHAYTQKHVCKRNFTCVDMYPVEILWSFKPHLSTIYISVMDQELFYNKLLCKCHSLKQQHNQNHLILKLLFSLLSTSDIISSLAGLSFTSRLNWSSSCMRYSSMASLWHKRKSAIWILFFSPHILHNCAEQRERERQDIQPYRCMHVYMSSHSQRVRVRVRVRERNIHPSILWDWMHTLGWNKKMCNMCLCIFMRVHV